MFAVIFEVNPIKAQWNKYLSYASLLLPEIKKIDGFVDNIRYHSLGRPGWLLSFSTWRDEKSLIRWRTHALHHRVQDIARQNIFHDYHLRVGEICADSATFNSVESFRQDETEVGIGKIVTVIQRNLNDATENMAAFNSVEHDLFEAILTPGEGLDLITSRDSALLPPLVSELRIRRRDVRIIRDYGMFDRCEAPQFFPEVALAGVTS